MTTEAKELTIREPNWTAPMVPLPITSHDDYVAVADALKGVKGFEKSVEAWFAPLVQKAHAAWKGLTTRRAETLAPAKAWEAECKNGLAKWDAEQERIRQEEQRRLEAEARKQEEQRRIEEAAALEAEGIAEADEEKLAEAERLIEEPVETPVVTVPKATPKVEGLSYRESWDAKVTDLPALIRYVAANPQYQTLLVPNQIALRAQARSLKGNLKIPGVKPVMARVVAQR